MSWVTMAMVMLLWEVWQLVKHLMPALHELNQGFEEAIKDKEFLDEFDYYCKHYIGRPSPLYFAENLTKELGGAKFYLSKNI